MLSIHLIEAEKIPKVISEQISPADLFRLGHQMEKICIENKGIGLSAVQVGIPYNFFIVERDSKFEYYFNCAYEGNNQLIDSIEGCLSLKNKDGSFRRFKLKRHSEVAIKGSRVIESSEGKIILESFEKKESGLFGVVFQHEIDHASDILISHIGTEILVQ